MNSVLWEEVRELVENALTLPPGDRAAYLAQSHARPTVRRMAETLIASYGKAENFLEEPASCLLEPDIEPADYLIGYHIGAYEIVQELGRGGMATVYKARRVDAQFHHEVAIKLISRSLPSAFTIARFKAERQILAALYHPNIATLLDGGAIRDGLPYFVMELVQGKPIDEYAAEHCLSLEAKLALFQTVCSAVQHAHTHLIVHRDIKPSNILVSTDGVPKLLDFGIAKLLDPSLLPGGRETTTPLVRLLTPEYGSPEQIRGDTVTTATDVYSLGVVLFKLLTGRLPYTTGTGSFEAISHAICHTDPARPSAVAQTDQSKLLGDLDNIILKALSKDVAGRYATVAELCEDLRRYGQGMPVSARPASLAYRTRKFIMRNRLVLASVSIIFFLVLAGLIVTLREASLANTQRARAERRFNDVRKLANSLFAIHDAIETLPGSTPARKLLVDNAVRYLDSLAGEAVGDSGLQRELADAYGRLARIQGSPQEANLGDARAALASSRKASMLWDSVARQNPGNVEDQVNSAAGHRGIAFFLGINGEAGEENEVRHALAIDQSLAAHSSSSRLRRELARTLETLARIQDGKRHFSKALDLYQQANLLASAELQSNPADPRAMRGFAVNSTLLADQLFKTGHQTQAIQKYGSSIAIFQQLATQQNNASSQRDLAAVLAKRSESALNMRSFKPALADAQRAFKIIRTLAAADPQNAQLQQDLAGSYSSVGVCLLALGRNSEGMALVTRALNDFTRLQKSNPTYTDLPYILGSIRTYRGDAFYRTHRTGAALDEYHRAFADFESVARLPGQDDSGAEAASTQIKIGSILFQAHRFTQAESEFRAAIQLVQPLLLEDNSDAREAVARAWYGLARLYAARESTPHACEYYGRSVENWKNLPPDDSFDLSGLDLGTPLRAAEALRSCGAQH